MCLLRNVAGFPVATGAPQQHHADNWSAHEDSHECRLDDHEVDGLHHKNRSCWILGRRDPVQCRHDAHCENEIEAAQETATKDRTQQENVVNNGAPGSTFLFGTVGEIHHIAWGVSTANRQHNATAGGSVVSLT